MIQSATSPETSGGAQSAGGALSQATSQQVGKNGFLKMLVTQLKNQNPTDPMKGRDFASQLAQFSSVEKLTTISDQIKSQKGANQALTKSVNSGVATDLIGRTVEAAGNQFTQKNGQKKTLGMDLSSSASEVTVTIRDSGGNAGPTRAQRPPMAPTPSTWRLRGRRAIRWRRRPTSREVSTVSHSTRRAHGYWSTGRRCRCSAFAASPSPEKTPSTPPSIV
ncbi:MAG: hypothetical protein BRD35_08265 [Bacteroidetes bacterium QH_7_62_13]|nr:MAG: hypothetical protein BRD35_08265 [Bacteroidetes bacterium QH_7_62_13]